MIQPLKAVSTDVCYNMADPWKYSAKWKKPDTKGHMLCCDSIYIKCLKWSEVAQSCPALCDPMDCSPPGSFVHGILQARTLEWGAISFSRGSSRPRDRTQVSHIAGRFFNLWATREAHIKCLLLLSRFSRVWLGATPLTGAHQASPSMGFSRQEHWSWLPFPSTYKMYRKDKSIETEGTDRLWWSPGARRSDWKSSEISSGDGCRTLWIY